MVINLTSPTQGQWKKVLKVVGWLLLSSALAIASAYIANNPAWLATLPGWNILGVVVQQILTTEEDTAIANVPSQVVAEAKQAGLPLPTVPSVNLPEATESEQ